VNRPIASADDVARAAGILGRRAVRDAALGARTTYRVGGGAALLVEAQSLEDLAAVARCRRETALPLLVVGRGSNLLVADRGFRGIVVVLGPWCESIALRAERVVAGGAVSLPVLARRSAAAGLRGLEWAVGVPGSVGGAVRMNAGGHGSDIAASLEGVRVYDLQADQDGDVVASDLELGFRRSALDDHQVVLAATFVLAPGDRGRSEAEIAEIVRWRREHQPGGQNAGSVFVNPLPGSAGRIIDALGLRGLRIGTARVSEKHANFVQADEGGSADDVHAVMVEVRRRVLEATGVALRSEVRLVGFDDDEVLR